MPMPVRDDPETLDPADWSELRALGHRMVDDVLGFLESVRERPVWQPVLAAVRARLDLPVPVEPQGAEAAYRDFLEDVLPYPHGNVHPRFWGWVVGTGSPLGALAELLAAGMNSNAGFGEQAAPFVELQVVRWLKELFGFPAAASGALVSGCSVANLTCLAVARDARAGGDVRRLGVAGARGPLCVYGSDQTHSSVLRALAVLGLGSGSFRAVPAGDDFRVDVDRLRERVLADRRAGRHGFCVVANAGTVDTGAFDDLRGLAAVCAELGLWLHVDGAFGALAALAPELRACVDGLELADSLAFDLHKWLHVPYDAGGVLVRDARHLRESFALEGAYLSPFESGVATGPLNFMEQSLQMSRGFRALKVWLTVKAHGVAKLGRLVARNVRQARYLAERIEAEPDLELLAPVPLNVVCFRWAPAGVDAARLDARNAAILRELHDAGIAAPSHTRIRGRFAIRVAITNHRSRLEDFDLLVREVVARGGR